MKSEPSLGLGGALSAILFAVVSILKAAGVGVTDEMTDGLNALVYAMCATPLVSGAIIRFFVYSPNSVETIARQQYAAGTPPTVPQPDVPPPAEV